MAETKAVCCYLDIDIDDARTKHQRLIDFLAAKNLAYGLSSNLLSELGGSEKARLPELYEADYEWSAKGEMLMALPPQRIVVELDEKRAPLACENFKALCTGEKGKSKQSGKILHYKNCPFHRIVKGFVAQGGDITTGTGAGGESIFAKRTFKDDLGGLKVKLGEKGLVGMCNSGKNSNTSQFFFSLGPKTAKLTGQHVVFGKVVAGLEVLDAIEKAGAENDEGKPVVSVVIVDCGIC